MTLSHDSIVLLECTYDIAVSSLPVESSLITDHINMAKPTGIKRTPANKPTRGEVMTKKFLGDNPSSKAHAQIVKKPSIKPGAIINDIIKDASL